MTINREVKPYAVKDFLSEPFKAPTPPAHAVAWLKERIPPMCHSRLMLFCEPAYQPRACLDALADGTVCRVCGALVWVSPSSRKPLTDGATAVCVDCAEVAMRSKEGRKT